MAVRRSQVQGPPPQPAPQSYTSPPPSQPYYAPLPPPPSRPHLRLGMALVFIGIFLTSFGIEQAASCSLSAPGTCPEILDQAIVGLGVFLMIVGFVLMLITRKPLTPPVVYLPKPQPASAQQPPAYAPRPPPAR